ncbi:MAG: peptide-methionine (S)-S-oxide reductase MsrA [Rhodospirillales bacterium]
MAAVLAILPVAAFLWHATNAEAETTTIIPPPASDAAAAGATSAKAVLAGGCFWGVQGVYQHMKGVTRAVSGYAGGTAETASYDQVSRGRTTHAEAVEITYDPRQVSYGQILHVFFSVIHDPTQKDRQGPDVGPHYRSAVFPVDAEQKRVAEAYIAQLDKARAYPKAIATVIEPKATFHAAEDYHQDYMVRHPNQPYIAFHDLPKLAAFKRVFAGFYRDDPVLVMNGN